MIELLNIPEEFCLKRKNPQNLIERIFTGDDSNIRPYITKLEWVASIKPGVANITLTRTETTRYDEIEVISLEVTDTQELYHICVPICRAIRYPCLLDIQFQDRFLLGVCPFHAGKVDYDKNILRQMVFSHWIFPDLLSSGARKLLSDISVEIVAEGDAESIYIAMKQCIQNFTLRGLTKNHVNALSKDLAGKNWEKIFASCVPYKKYLPAAEGARGRYSARSSQYIYRYDTEDLWHAYMSDERIRTIIEKRRYRDMSDLIYSIDSKYEVLRDN